MSQTKAIVDKLLTNVSVGFVNEGLIADQIFPELQSKQKTGKIGSYGTSHLRVERSITGGRSAYRRVEAITRETDTYSINSHGLEGLVTEDDYANVEEPFDAEKDETVGLTSLIAVEKEKIFADTLMSASVITQGVALTGQQKFSDYANSNPIGVFSTARSAIKTGCGAVANLAVMSWEVYQALRYHPAFLDALGYKESRPGGLAVAELAKVLEVERLLIGNASYEAAKEGQASNLQPIWGKGILFAVSPKAPTKWQTSLGYQMKLSGRKSRRVMKWDVKNPPNSTAILVDDHYDLIITAQKAGYLIRDAIA